MGVCVCLWQFPVCLSLCVAVGLVANGRASERWRMEIYGALLVERSWCTRRLAAGGRRADWDQGVLAPFTLCPLVLARC